VAAEPESLPVLPVLPELPPLPPLVSTVPGAARQSTKLLAAFWWVNQWVAREYGAQATEPSSAMLATRATTW
jgi:hypothetical protein